MKAGVHIIECLDGNDPGSEGRCLSHLFDLLRIKSIYEHVDTIDELIRAMASSDYKYIHISTHGLLSDDEKFLGWWTPKGHGRKKKMADLKDKLTCKAVISTACKSGCRGFGEYVVQELGSKHFIGPKKSPSFAGAILFSHILYHKLFLTKRSLKKAFSSYRDGYRNPYQFTIYSDMAAEKRC